MVLLCKSKKHSVIKEEIFENRFMHCAELNRMGAKIKTKGISYNFTTICRQCNVMNKTTYHHNPPHQ